ncbi:hypothetical protein D3C80_1750120 [compost metagenome]
MGQGELLDAVEVFLTGAALDHFQLAGDQGVPDLVLGFRVVDETVLVWFAGHVLRCFHGSSGFEACCCDDLSIARPLPLCSSLEWSRGGVNKADS